MTTPPSPIQSEIQRVAENHFRKFYSGQDGLTTRRINAALITALTSLATPLQQRVDLAETNFQTAQKQVADLMNEGLGLRQKVWELEDAIRDVLTQQGDDLCWMDIYTKLSKLVGVKFEPAMLPKSVMLKNCERFIDSLKTGKHYTTQTDLETQNKVLREALEKASKERWQDGCPNKILGQNWFIAMLDTGERVVLRSLPEEYSYDYTTGDDTYYAAKRIKKWMQFLDGTFKTFIDEALATTTQPAQKESSEICHICNLPLNQPGWGGCSAVHLESHPDTELLTAAQALCLKIHQIHNDALYQSAWTLFQIHGGDYSKGLSYAPELYDLEQAIRNAIAKERK